MKLVTGLALQYNAIKILEGFTGVEPKEILQRANKIPGSVRGAIAINTYYPQVAGGFYVNYDLVGLVHACWDNIGLKVVLEEVFSESGIIPIERSGCLLFNARYFLVDSSGIQGSLFLWTFHAGGADRFYKDAIVLDIIIKSGLWAEFRQELLAVAKRNKIEFELAKGRI